MPPRSRRSARRTSSAGPGAALRAACGCVAAALAVGAALGALLLARPSLRTASPPAVVADAPGPDVAGIRALVLRTMRGSGAADGGSDRAAPSPGAEAWTGALARGELSLADLLLRSFTGTRYLLAGADDAAFAADVHAAVLDSAPTAADAEDAADALASGDRIAYLARFLARPDVAAACAGLGVSPGTVPAAALIRAKAGGSPAGAIAADVAEPLPPDGGYAFGALGSRGTVDLGGLDGRVDFLVDRRVANQSFSDRSGESEDAAGPQAYAVSWNADLESPGVHETAVLARRADGRGLRIDGGTCVVPRLRDLEAGALVEGTFAEGGADDFYRIASGGGRNALRLLAAGAEEPDGSPSALPSLRAYRRAGEPLDATLSAGDGAASLGVRTDEPGTIYLQVSRTDPDAGTGGDADDAAGPAYRAVLDADFAVVRIWTASATLRAAPGSASDAVGTLKDGTVAALLGEGTDPDGDLWYRIRTTDAEGYAYSEQIRPLRFAGRIAALSIALPGGDAVRLAPAFDAETAEYGLVLPADAASFDLSFRAREGALAEVGASIGPESADGASVGLSGDAGTIAVPQGASVLRLSVASADRTAVRTYVLHLYRPPGTDGFDATLAAFPASYHPALFLLHATHPSWTFDAFPTGVRFDAFLAAEGYRDRCLLPEGQVPASFLEPGSPVYDGTSWKAASDAAIARFADPRVFLSERDIFQFERLTFLPDVQTEAGVAAILSGTFFEEPTVDADGSTIEFARLFHEAGRDAGASPYFLATRSLQEMGRTGTPLSFGTVPGHEGYFNYFNIGSLPDPSVPNGAQINGALFAQYGWLPAEAELTQAERAILLPWTTRSLAVRGGARHIASRYIAVGQDTQYLQKFDLIPDTGLYTHQYMQNLLAPRNESRRMFRAYRATGLLEAPFAFRIPVFEAMPDEPAPEP